jgi:phage-related protein
MVLALVWARLVHLGRSVWMSAPALPGIDNSCGPQACIIFYTFRPMDDERQIRWVGSAYGDLLGFPKDVRKEAGFQLGKVQVGLEPADWKPFDAVGAGTREIRIRDESGAYRVMYVAKFEEAIYVLHCFQKKTQSTGKQDRAIAAARYRAVTRARKEMK